MLIVLIARRCKMETIDLTIEEVRDRENELDQVKKELENVLLQQQIAKGQGDLSENSEYEIATAEATRLQARKQELSEELSNYNVITPGTGARITLGNSVAVTELDTDGNPVGAERVFRLVRDHGDTVKKATLGLQSPLGKAIIDGTDGVYVIQAPLGSVSFKVRKVL